MFLKLSPSSPFYVINNLFGCLGWISERVDQPNVDTFSLESCLRIFIWWFYLPRIKGLITEISISFFFLYTSISGWYGMPQLGTVPRQRSFYVRVNLQEGFCYFWVKIDICKLSLIDCCMLRKDHEANKSSHGNHMSRKTHPTTFLPHMLCRSHYLLAYAIPPLGISILTAPKPAFFHTRKW